MEALVHALVDRGAIDAQALHAATEKVEELAGEGPGRPEAIGPRLVARAWKDPAFKAALLRDAAAALKTHFGVDATNATAPTKLIVVANEDSSGAPAGEGARGGGGVHNLVVCTLCSCYPLSILGLSPGWYKDVRYRARAVRQPRKLLAEFGTHLDPTVDVRVHDSTADCRYLVLPARPHGTAGWSEDALAQLVSRDSMIGVAIPTAEAVAT